MFIEYALAILQNTAVIVALFFALYYLFCRRSKESDDTDERP
jgi:hypothetical protein